jgi:hypothetical protein
VPARCFLWKVLAAAALVAVVLVPVASARSSPRVDLSLIPLRASALGSAARGLALANDSGALSANSESQHAFFGALHLQGIGRITGYALHYGNEANGLPGLDSVWTSIDKYKNARDAKRGLRLWRERCGDDLAEPQR